MPEYLFYYLRGTLIMQPAKISLVIVVTVVKYHNPVFFISS